MSAALERRLERLDRLAPKNMTEWDAGFETGWLDSAENPGSNPEGSDDFVFGWYCASFEFQFWQWGWDDFHAGQTIPRFDPDVPETEELWKQGYTAAFLGGDA